MNKPDHTAGAIQVNQPINEMGQISDINGVSWEVISVWKGGDYVTAAKTEDISNSYSRWHPYSVTIVS